MGQADITLSWYRAVFGTGIGDAGLAVGDLDGDGSDELVASASGAGFAPNVYWYVVEPDAAGYRQRSTSFPFDADLDRMILVQLDQDAAVEILLAVGGQLFIYDGFTLEPQSQIPTPVSRIRGLAAADLDGDPAVEAVFCDLDDAWVYDLDTGTAQLPLPGFGCNDLAVGETDGTSGLEVVVAAESAGYVLDALTGAVEWNHPLGFGDYLALGDLDGDGLDEIAAGFAWSGIDVWHGDTHAFAWGVSVFNLATLVAGDVEGDGDVELLYGDAQWGDVHVLLGATGTELWSVSNPEHGVTRIAVGDIDQDAVRELYFGAGFTSTGPDHLYVVDTSTHVIEWESADISGPFLGLAHGDVDADGEPELVYTTFGTGGGWGNGLYFVHDAGTHELEYQSPPGSTSTGLWKVQLADIDLDPALEIFLPASNGYTGELQCWDGASHALQWETPLVSGLTFASLRVADPDGDDQLELASGVEVQHTGAPGVYVQVHDAASGNLEWQSPNLESFFGFFTVLDLMRVADIDYDGHGELVVAERGDGLLALDPVAGTIDLGAPGLGVTALETIDFDGDGVDNIVIGTADGLIQLVDATTGVPTTLAGPYGGAIDGLAIADLVGDGTRDFVFASTDRVHIVDGATLQPAWISGDLGTGVGRSDSLVVADLDGNGNPDIWVNAGNLGHVIFSVSRMLFGDGFESGDTSAWSATVP